MSRTMETIFPMDRWDEIRRFMEKNYWSHLPILDRRIFEWQFQADLNGGRANVVTVWEGGRLIGMLGYMPVDIFWGDVETTRRGAWTANWVVDEDHRGDAGWLMLRQVGEMFDVTLGIGGKPETLKISKHLGWAVYPHIPRFLAILNKEAAASVAGSNLPDVTSVSIPNTAPVLQFLEDEGDYQPDWRHYPHMNHGTVRSYEHLKRQYIDHPIFRHFILIEGPPERPSLCVFRMQLAYDGEVSVRTGRVVEFFHPMDEVGKDGGLTLMLNVLAHLRDQGCAYLDIHHCNDLSIATLRRAGWIEEPAARQTLPGRVCPIDRNHRTTNRIIYADQANPPVPLSSLFVTGGDGDEDRAAMHPDLLAPKQPGITIKTGA